MFARACGKTNIHSLEPEDLAALTMEASAMAAVRWPGPTTQSAWTTTTTSEEAAMAGTRYRGSELKDINQFLEEPAGLDSDREKEIGQHIGYRYDVNLVPDYDRITPFLSSYIEVMGWDDLNWLEDVHMGYEEGKPAVFDRNINGWVRVPTRSSCRTTSRTAT